MSFKVNYEKMDQIFNELKKDYKVYAPVRLKGQGRYSDTDVIRYKEIDSVSEIVYDEKSDFSPKEVIHPITQTLFYFTEHQFRESEVDDKELLIFARPCDINGFKRMDKIFLENGDFSDDYSVGFRFNEDNLKIEVKDNDFLNFFENESEIDFSPEFVDENNTKVNIPEIDSEEILQQVYDLDMWEEYNDRCESCGACTASCVTCSCFTTRDVTYTENGKAGERRRNWASCLHEDFTEMAGGHSFRETPAERMRFRTLHKIYDYKERFGEDHMCVGCGRCTDACNELISFSSTINKLSEAVQNLKA